MVANGSIIQDGPFVALFICLDVDYASEVVTQALKGEILPEPEPTIPADAITDVKELRDWLVSYCGMEETELELLDDSDSDALNFRKSICGLFRFFTGQQDNIHIFFRTSNTAGRHGLT